MTKHTVYLEMPVGTLCVEATETHITGLKLHRQPVETQFTQSRSPLTDKACKQLQEYFAGKRQAFDLPLMPEGTEFQKSVWNALQTIPFGETRSYKDIAVQIGNPKAVRAVGQANNRNPVMLVIPCHRVVGADGSLTGYAAGLDVKQKLLDWESGKASC
ncbi:MAG: methylated-DNA--[protein]-cysteine S-methyltransferase [Planctomycetaceae bacterium]|nr:methylated-DNA--[protein]-cysteine S-methyltransferase [Planctomycetaceae bacterium]